jgi:hypothetical protein
MKVLLLVLWLGVLRILSNDTATRMPRIIRRRMSLENNVLNKQVAFKFQFHWEINSTKRNSFFHTPEQDLGAVSLHHQQQYSHQHDLIYS